MDAAGSPNVSATTKALDYSLKRWVALTRYLEDGAVPIDNNQVKVQHEVASPFAQVDGDTTHSGTAMRLSAGRPSHC